jgi:histidyl-tRNA synthetase
VAGGGRYDGLVKGLSDGAADLPAIGFGMGDVVLGHLIDETPAATEKLKDALAQTSDVFVVIADESRRAEALQIVQTCRELGLSTDFPLKSAKVGKQFQEAENLGAIHAVVIGQEWPQIKLQHLATRAEQTLDHAALAPTLKTYKLHS